MIVGLLNKYKLYKKANIGLSLSKTEASIAASFTAYDLNVSSILDLIKESRGYYNNFKYN